VSGSLLVLTPLGIEQAALGAPPGAQVLRTGMGPRRARIAAARALGHDAPALAVAGVCAGIAPELRAGDVICATELVADGGARVPVPGSALLVAALKRRGLRVHIGPLVSTERILSPAERRALAAQPGHGDALGVDMESAWLADGAGGRPLVVVRVVADAAGRHLADPRMAYAGARALYSLRRAGGAIGEWARAVGPHTVLLAGPRSFCAGVDRAIDIVELALLQRGVPVYVRKQIVHNEHVVADLERRGAVFVDELDEVPEGATVVFSAHGVAPDVRRNAASRSLDVIDATCPLVSKVHAEARGFAAQGRTIFLIGHRGHEEVEGTMGEAPGAMRLVEDITAAERIEVPEPERVSYLTQTTLAVDETDEIVAVLRERFPALRGPASDDICYATANRQHAVRAVAHEAEVVLVAGSQTSSNSKRLVEVAEREGARAYLVDDETEVDVAWLAGVSTVAITAGASAPERIVTRLVDALATLGPVDVEERTTTTESLQFRLPKEVAEL
jgi:4-hydroxy-3-methylbut-2-enyl diphosphate reductase